VYPLGKEARAMRSVCFALVVAVALGVAGVAAKADTVDPAPGSPAVDAVEPGGQVGTPDSQIETAESGESEGKKIRVSVEYSPFLPGDADARSTFGTVWGSFGIGLFRPERPERWAFDWDLTVLSQSGESDVLLIPLTVGAQRGFGKDPDLQPYVALRAGPYYGSVEDNLKGPDDTKIGASANVSAGLVLQRRYLLEARYDWFSELAGNDLSGFTLTLGVKVFEFSL
jgi:hypothetical protein